MNSSQDQTKISKEDEELLMAIQLSVGTVLPLAMKVAMELDLFEIMAKAGTDQLSSSEIASHLPTKNSEAPVMVERLLRLLASNSILTCTLADDGAIFYGLAPICKYFVRDQDGVSVAPLYLLQDQVFFDCWYHLKDAVLEGGLPFMRAHGMQTFEYFGKNNRFNEVFNKAMYNHTTISIKKILEKYKGFEGVKELVDVGGGLGATLGTIVSKYPQIRGINFDLPHVIKDAPPLPGVEHVGGDMFESVPKGEVIFMKWILHDWSDDHCLKLLKNCWNALPESGKVIVVEYLLPECPEINLTSKTVSAFDMLMLTTNHYGKERKLKEYEALAKGAGFTTSKLICHACLCYVMEFYKIM